MKVLYIVGSSRCGSTILGNILGELDGFFNGGEIRFLWTRVLQGRRCGCGLAVDHCTVWSAVLPSAGRGLESIRELHETQHSALRLGHSARLLRRSPKRLLLSAQLGPYMHAMSDLYKRLGEATEASIIVDSSKRPSNAAVLQQIDGIEPYLIHLVRDARGVAHSRLRPKANPDGIPSGAMPMMSPWRNAVDWTATNLAAEDVMRHWVKDRRMLIRYEDFIGDPRGTIGRIAALVGEPMQPDPFIDARSVRLGPNHTVAGNPDRFQRGTISLHADVEWVGRMRPFDRRVTTTLTLPLLIRYGYSIRARTASPARRQT